MTKRNKALALTGNDVARMQGAISLGIAWWKDRGKQKPSKYGRVEIGELKKLAAKLNAIGDHAYPYSNDLAPDDYGDETIMRLDGDAVAKTRARARKWKRADDAGDNSPE